MTSPLNDLASGSPNPHCDPFHQYHGYHIGALMIPLEDRIYNAKIHKLDEYTTRIEELTQQQKDINALSHAIMHERKKGLSKIDLSGPETSHLVDAVRAVNPGLIPHGEYSWSKDLISYVTDSLNGQIRAIETEISNKMTYNNADMQELAELIKQFKDLNKQHEELNKSIIRNR